MVSVMALLAFGLAIFGLYAVVTYSVGRRTREFGIRMAVGARRADILQLVLREGGRLSLTGIVLGLVLSIPISRLLSAAFVGVGPLSLWTLAIVPVGLALATIAACLTPAWRAAVISPTTVLRLD
jgi:putative ABC transport system permease protein